MGQCCIESAYAPVLLLLSAFVISLLYTPLTFALHSPHTCMSVLKQSATKLGSDKPTPSAKEKEREKEAEKEAERERSKAKRPSASSNEEDFLGKLDGSSPVKVRERHQFKLSPSCVGGFMRPFLASSHCCSVCTRRRERLSPRQLVPYPSFSCHIAYMVF